MITFNIKTNKSLVGRDAVYFVQSLTPIRTEIYIDKEGRRINAKSILGLLSADICKNDVLEIAVLDDCESNNVLETLKKFFEKE